MENKKHKMTEKIAVDLTASPNKFKPSFFTQFNYIPLGGYCNFLAEEFL